MLTLLRGIFRKRLIRIIMTIAVKQLHLIFVLIPVDISSGLNGNSVYVE